MSHESVFTCVTCNVAFNAFELQRDHYKTDWHRYNLKRKIAELPSVSHKEFQERLSIQKAQNENAQNPSQEEMFCTLCSKHFNTANAFTNHLNSKKHKELVDASAKSNEDKSFAVKGDRNAKKAEQAQKEADEAAAAEEAIEVEEEVDEKDWEDVDEEDIDSIDESQGIDVQSCLFCPHKASSVEAKCEHMAREHSFFIPDMDHVSDVEGLLRFLGVKVGAYHVCLWCSSKCYRTLDAVQKHMSDKGHQKMRFEGETLLEYADFYEYEDDEDDSLDKTDGSYDVADDFDIKTISRISSSFREDVENGDSQGDVSYELVLPSGAKIGHRSLFKYYKQSFGHRNLELKKKSNLSVKDKYKAIAYGQSYSVTEIQKQRKDLAYFQRWSAKMSAKLGWETNKLQKHFRRQDICF